MAFRRSICVCVVAVGVVVLACMANRASAQCCGATTAAYQPVAYSAYSPVVYQTYRTGWYPGYYLDRVRARLWGAPSTYVAAYPSTYVAAYPSAYYASYPTYAASYAASYAPACSSCAATQQVTLRPVCSTCCDPCTSCSSCSSGASYGVSQTSYQESGGCGCGSGGSAGQSSGTTIVVPNGTVMTPGSQQVPSGGGQQPQLPESFEATPRSSQKPVDEGQAPLEPEPANTGSGAAEGTQDGAGGSNGAYLQPPPLFSPNPNDRTAARKMPPVRMAVYEQPVSQKRVSQPVKVTRQQADRDAIGWHSAAN
jgi:hypothetical protein